MSCDEGAIESGARHRILHIGGNIGDARMVREALAASTSERYDVEWVGTLTDGLERLASNGISAVLLDLQLPECAGIDGLQKLLRAAPSIPILVVGVDDNQEIARQVVGAGAHDYLLRRRAGRSRRYFRLSTAPPASPPPIP